MKFLKTLVLASALVVPAFAAYAQSIDVPAGTYKADGTHTNVLWSVSHFGLSNYIGRFDKIEATLELDPADVTKSSLTVKIDPKSVNVNYPDTSFATEIAGEKFFNSGKFADITFVSKEIKTTGDNTGTVTGDLTFHGVTKPVTLDVTFNKALNPHPMSKKPVVGFSAKGTIKRSDFGVSALVGPVGDDVALTIETEFVGE